MNPDPTSPRLAPASVQAEAEHTSAPARVALTGERVSLRPNRSHFAPLLCAAAQESAATVGRWMSWWHTDFTLTEAAAWLEQCEQKWATGVEFEFSVFDPAGAYVGAAGLNQRNEPNNFANLGYWIRQSRQGEGLAVDAVRLLSAFGFEVLKLTRIEIVAAWENTASRRVAEKAGATFEGRARHRLLLRGEPLDAAMYALLPAHCTEQDRA